MVSTQDLCSVFNKVINDGWGVVSGFNGQVLRQDMIDDKITDEAVKKSASKWIGKHVVDAGGLFSYVFRTLGIPDTYVPDGTYPATIFNSYCSETGKLPKGGLLPGMVMFKKNGNRIFGVGLYIGNSRIIEAKSSKTGVVASVMTSEWTYWGKLKDIEYPELPSKAALRKKSIRDMRVLRGAAEITNEIRSVNIREDKSLSAPVQDVLHPGDGVTVIEDCGEFCRVQYVKTGYIKKNFLKEAVSNAGR